MQKVIVACLVILFGILLLLGCLGAAAYFLIDGDKEAIVESATATASQVIPSLLPVEAVSCETIVQRAYDLTQQFCDDAERDTACYGNVQIAAQPETVAFGRLGDIAPLDQIDSLRLSSMNTNRQEWGVSLMRIQANLSDENPAQAVELLLFGDVNIEDTSDNQSQETQFGAMQAFTFISGEDDRPCPSAPDSGIMIQTPQGVGEITLFINEVVVDLGSTAYIQAQPNGELVVNVIEGQGKLTAFGITVTVPAGMRSRVSLDSNGEASGSPSPAEPYTANDMQVLPTTLLDRPITFTQPQGQATATTVGLALRPSPTVFSFNTVTPIRIPPTATQQVALVPPTITATTVIIPSATPAPSLTPVPSSTATEATILTQAVNITAEGRVLASSTYEGYSVNMAADGDFTSSWFSTGPEPSGSPTQYSWIGYQDDLISEINILSNAKNADPNVRTNFGFGVVTVQVLDTNNKVVYETSVDLAGTPDPDVFLEPNVIGRSVVLWFSGHEDRTCGGFGELEIIAIR